MSRLWVMSDLHQELARFPWAPPRPDFDILVVAGDVYEGDIVKALDWIVDLADGRPSVFVPGNHEFWHDTIDAVLAKGREHAARRCVTLLDGQGWVRVGDVSFTGCTLWTDQAFGQGFGSRLYQQDFGEPIVALAGGKPIRVSGEEMLGRHASDVAGLEGSLGQDPLSKGPRAVVTHHAPHPRSLNAMARRSPMAAASVSDLGYLVECGAADLWVHGHIHQSADYALEGSTRVLCNPFGYHGNNDAFDEALVVDTAGFCRD